MPLLRRNVGCVFQDFKLLPSRTAAENVAYALKVQGESRTSIRRKVPEVMNMVGLAHKMDSLPDELSGGEQQRVSIARAVVNHPPLLVCDEPTGNLDPDTSVGIMQLLYRINRAGTTILMVTHDREMVDKMRKRVIALEDGTARPRRAPRRIHVRMSARTRLLFSEAWSSITANISTTFAATMTVLIGMFLLGLFIALGTWVLSWSDHVKKELQVKVYFAAGATQQQEAAVGASIRKDAAREVRHLRLEGEGGRADEGEVPRALRDAAAVEPVPRRVGRDPDEGRLHAGARQGRSSPEHYAGVNDVRWGSKTAKRVLTIAEVIWIAFLVAVVLLVTASTLLIANTIRLSIFARRREIEVMKLVGATNWFIRGPFMLEGLLCGLGGSILAVVLLVLGKEVALPSILPHIGGGSDVHALPFALNALSLLGAGLLLGAAGSGLTLRRFLQV